MSDPGQGGWIQQPDGLHFSGGVDFSNVVRLEQEAKLWLEHQVAEICALDLAKMERCNSAGGVLLLGMFRAAHQKNKKLLVRNPPDNLLSLMRLSSLDHLLTPT